MILILEPFCDDKLINNALSILNERGFTTHLSKDGGTTIIGCYGDGDLSGLNPELIDGVKQVVPVSETYKLANKAFHLKPSTIHVHNTVIGGDHLTVMAGPCAIESEDQLLTTARAIKASGATLLRGGAYKPRTSPYAFQGLEEEGLKFMALARNETGLATVCEVVSPSGVEVAAKYVDVLQIGARNMQNFYLLKEVGKTNLPVLLKRGLCSTIEEWLNAAEYIMSEGNTKVILCERGIRTYETATRNTLDLSAVPALRARTHLPIIVDPSHGTGVKAYIPPMAKAAVAAGANGLMIEVHPNPKTALSDGPQSLDLKEFDTLMTSLRPYAKLEGKTL